MALARVKTWNAGDTLTAADLNAEYNNILNNPISLVSPTTGAINFQTSVAHSNLQAATLTVSSGTRGQALMVTSSAGSQWSNLGVGSRVRGLTGNVTTGQTVTLAADEYLLRTTDVVNPASYILTATGTFTVNVGTAGPAANGRDVAAAFSSTFLHIYAITTGLGSTTPAGVASTTPSPTGPVLPTSYSAWTYLGTYPYTSASTQFLNAQRVKGSWIYNETAQSLLSSGGATVETALSLTSGLVPVNALCFQIACEARFIDNTNNQAAQVLLRTTSGINYGPPLSVRVATTFIGYQNTSIVMPNTSQNMYYLWSPIVTNAPVYAADILVQGYNIPNGGE